MQDVSNPIDSAGYIFHLLSLLFTGSGYSGGKKEDRNHGSDQFGHNLCWDQSFARIPVGICKLGPMTKSPDITAFRKLCFLNVQAI